MFRITHNNFEKIFDWRSFDTFNQNEWSDVDRLKESGWDNRYDYESDICKDIINENSFKSILEIGSGPGVLSQKIQSKTGEVDYHLVDKPYAKKYFEENKLKGKFFNIDISTGFNIETLSKEYDFIICNDVLEHVLNPSSVVTGIRSLMKDTSKFMCSIPNWRMAHQMVYRGLFDYDNFIYFMYIHGFGNEDVYGSPLQTPQYPKLDSEKSMPDELLQSWNFYFVFNKRTVV